MDLKIKIQTVPFSELEKENHFTADESLTTEGLLEMLQLGQHLKLLRGPAVKGPTLVVAKISDSKWNCTWFEAIGLNYSPVNWEGFGARQNRCHSLPTPARVSTAVMDEKPSK